MQKITIGQKTSKYAAAAAAAAAKEPPPQERAAAELTTFLPLIVYIFVQMKNQLVIEKGLLLLLSSVSFVDDAVYVEENPQPVRSKRQILGAAQSVAIEVGDGIQLSPVPQNNQACLTSQNK